MFRNCLFNIEIRLIAQSVGLLKHLQEGLKMINVQMLKRGIDFIVPFGVLLRRAEGELPFASWRPLLMYYIPRTFFLYWLFSLVPHIGTFTYMLVFVPLSAWEHIKDKDIECRTDRYIVVLWYYTVILIGFGGLWNFIGHTVMADTVAEGIGWAKGSPFQIELAFYTLGTAVAALAAVWLRGHMITALIISKSIFLYGAAYVHINDIFVHSNFAPLNVGSVLVGDIVFPTIWLLMLFFVLKAELHQSVNVPIK